MDVQIEKTSTGLGNAYFVIYGKVTALLGGDKYTAGGLYSHVSWFKPQLYTVSVDRPANVDGFHEVISPGSSGSESRDPHLDWFVKVFVNKPGRLTVKIRMELLIEAVRAISHDLKPALVERFVRSAEMDVIFDVPDDVSPVLEILNPGIDTAAAFYLLPDDTPIYIYHQSYSDFYIPVTVRAYDPFGTGISRVEFNIDDLPRKQLTLDDGLWRGNDRLPLTSLGMHQLKVYGYDNAGLETNSLVNFKCEDNTPPVITVDNFSDEIAYSSTGTKFTLTGQVSDPETRVTSLTYTINDSPHRDGKMTPLDQNETTFSWRADIFIPGIFGAGRYTIQLHFRTSPPGVRIHEIVVYLI